MEPSAGRCETCGRRLRALGEGYVCRNGHIVEKLVLDSPHQGDTRWKSVRTVTVRTVDRRKEEIEELPDKEVRVLVLVEMYSKLLRRVGISKAAEKTYEPIALRMFRRMEAEEDLQNVKTLMAVCYFIRRSEEEAKGAAFLHYDFRRVFLAYNAAEELKEILKKRGLEKRQLNLCCMGEPSLKVMRTVMRKVFPKSLWKSFRRIREIHLESLCNRFGVPLTTEVLGRFRSYARVLQVLVRKKLWAFSEIYAGLFLLYHANYSRGPGEGRVSDDGAVVADKQAPFASYEMRFSLLEQINAYLLGIERDKGLKRPHVEAT